MHCFQSLEWHSMFCNNWSKQRKLHQAYSYAQWGNQGKPKKLQLIAKLHANFNPKMQAFKYILYLTWKKGQKSWAIYSIKMVSKFYPFSCSKTALETWKLWSKQPLNGLIFPQNYKICGGRDLSQIIILNAWDIITCCALTCTWLFCLFCRLFDLEYSRWFLSSIFHRLLLVTGIIWWFTMLNCHCILFTKLPWPGDSERTFRSSSQAATCPPVYHTRRRLHTVPLIAEHQAGKL